VTPNFASLTLLRFTLSFAIAGHCATAQEPEKRPAEEVQDNSFLIEEAYNQEPASGMASNYCNNSAHDNRFRQAYMGAYA